MFSVSVNGATVVPVTVSASATDDNTSLAHLVSDINDALATAGLGSQVQAGLVLNRLRLTAIDPAVTSFQLSIAANNPTITQLHFADGQQSTLAPDFDTIDSFINKVAEKLGVNPATLNPNYDAQTNLLTFGLNFGFDFSRPIALDFSKELDLGILGKLGLAGNADAAISGQANLNLNLGIDLHALGNANPLDFFFVLPGDGLSASFELSASDIDLSAALGNIEIGIEDGFIGDATHDPFTLSLSALLKDPNGSGRITLAELLQSPTQVIDQIDIDASGTAVLPLTLEGVEDLLGVTLPAAPTIEISVSAVNSADFDVDVTATGLEDIFSSLKELSVSDLLQLARNFIENILENPDLDLLNANLPLVNKSVRDLLAFAEPVLQAFDQVSARIAGLKALLLEKLDGTADSVTQGIQDILDSADLRDNLPPELLTKLDDAVAALRTAIESLPTTIDANTFKVPTKLISAFGAVKDAIAAIDLTPPSVPSASAAFAQIKALVSDVVSSVPSVQTAVNFLFDALGLANLVDVAGMQTTVANAIDAAVETLENALVSSSDAAAQAILTRLQSLQTQFDQILAIAQPKVFDLLGVLDDLVAVATDFATQVTNTAFDAAKAELADAITSFQGDFPGRIRFDFDAANKTLDVGFDFSIARSVTLPLDFAFANAIAGVLPIELESGGQFNAAVTGDVKIDLGLDLSNGVSAPFFRDTTSLGLTALIDASNLSATVNIAGIDAITLGPGSFTLKAANGTDPASLSLNLASPTRTTTARSNSPSWAASGSTPMARSSSTCRSTCSARRGPSTLPSMTSATSATSTCNCPISPVS